MAETADSSSSNSSMNNSPIFKITRDHIFTILLLLPVDSILSFGMTCKKFKSLGSCDGLWESICRRDWGLTYVDLLKSSINNNNQQQQHQQFRWMKLYRQVSLLDSFSCHKLCEPENTTSTLLPSPRASHSLNFVSDCLVLFGGGCEGGRHLDDTWVAYKGNNFPRAFNWQKVQSGVPSGRFGHTCVVISHFLVLFGGINDRGIRQNDTWIGQLVFCDNHCISISWRLLNVQSLAPPARGAHACCCIDQRKMVIHGGIGLNGVRLGDTWVLELSENLCFGTWNELMIHPSPPPRSGHSLTCIAGKVVVLFGGRGLGYDVLNDVWLLQMSGGQQNWVQMLYELQSIPDGVSLPRVGHSATLILGDRVLIYGGEDSHRHRKDDFWVLDISSIISTQLRQRKMWKRVQAKGHKPHCRSFHQACKDHSGRYLYVFGGMVDGGLQPVDASGLRFDGELFVLELWTLV